MEYEVIRLNDDGTAQVRMTINSHVLEQAFDTADLDTNVKQGMAVFNDELSRNVVDQTPPANITVGKVISVAPADLPAMPVDDPIPTNTPNPGA